MALLRIVDRSTVWPLGALFVGAVACSSEPAAPGDENDATASDAGPTSAATTATGDDGPGGPGSNTQGGSGDGTAGESDTSPPDTDTSPGSGSTDDDGPQDTGSTGEPDACTNGPLAFTWVEAPTIAKQPYLHGVAAALIDGDGFLDIAVSNYTNQSISIYLGDGAGGFAPGSQMFVPYPTSILLAPIADDTPDLFVRYHDPATFEWTIQRWRGDGSGNFQFAIDLGVAGTIRLGNFNGDPYLDAALVPSPSAPPQILEIRAGDINESFGPPVAIGDYGGEPRVGDLDADGDDDLVVFGAELVNVLINDNGVFSNTGQQSFFGHVIGAAELGDPTGDGNLDLITGTFAGVSTIAQIFPGNGAGELADPIPIPVSNHTAWAAAKDFDADGVDDVLLVAPSGALTFLHSNGDGTMAGEDVTAADGCLNAGGLVAEDINDDCIPDPILICSGGEEEVRVFLSQR